jgi:hypothetical protein
VLPRGSIQLAGLRQARGLRERVAVEREQAGVRSAAGTGGTRLSLRKLGEVGWRGPNSGTNAALHGRPYRPNCACCLSPSKGTSPAVPTGGPTQQHTAPGPPAAAPQLTHLLRVLPPLQHLRALQQQRAVARRRRQLSAALDVPRQDGAPCRASSALGQAAAGGGGAARHQVGRLTRQLVGGEGGLGLRQPQRGGRVNQCCLWLSMRLSALHMGDTLRESSKTATGRADPVAGWLVEAGIAACAAVGSQKRLPP